MENNLRKIRLQKQISLNEIVKKTGIPIQTLTRYDKGSTTIGMEHMVNLSDFLEVSMDDMFERKKKITCRESEH